MGDYVADPLISETTMRRLALHVLDILGALIGAARTQEAAMLRRLLDPFRGHSSSTPKALDMVAWRVATARLSEIDDIHLPSCVTPGAIVVPTALSLACCMGPVPAERLARALRAGYGVMTWMGTALGGPTILYRGIWPTYLLAPLGSAAVTAVLLELDAAGAADALALALTRISGGAGMPRGDTTRWFLAGEAARTGVSAALAAASGMAGDMSLLDGDWLKQVHAIEADPAALNSPLPVDGSVGALSMKPLCAAKQTQSAIAGFQQLLQAGLAVNDILRITVAVPPAYAGMIGHGRSTTRTDRLTGIAYLLSLCVFDTPDLFNLQRPPLRDSRIAEFMSKVFTVADPALQDYYPERWPARLEVTRGDGGITAATIIDAPGDPGAPLDHAAVRDKFRRLTAAEDCSAMEMLEQAALNATRDDGAVAALLSLLPGV